MSKEDKVPEVQEQLAPYQCGQCRGKTVVRAATKYDKVRALHDLEKLLGSQVTDPHIWLLYDICLSYVILRFSCVPTALVERIMQAFGWV